jgi:hypothetical protein
MSYTQEEQWTIHFELRIYDIDDDTFCQIRKCFNFQLESHIKEPNSISLS